MAYLENQTRPNTYETYYIKNPTSNIIFQGSPPWEIHVVGQDLVATQLLGDLGLVNISILDCNWSLYPTKTNLITFNASNQLNVIGTTLYFNGNPIATTSNISNVSDWSLYVALQAVQMCNFNLVWGANTLNGSTGSLLFNGNPIAGTLPSNWSAYPALSNVNFCNFLISNITGVASTGNFNVATGAGCNLTVNGSPLTFNPSNWANYPAVGDVNLSNHNLTHFSNIYSDQTNSSWIATAPVGALNNVNINLLTDGTTNVGGAAPNRINLTAQNGYYGQINLTANSGLSNVSPLGGVVNIIANGGFANPGTSASYGGTINITANSGPLAEIYLTSKVVTTAASVLSYAGVITPPLSTDGYNFIYGTGGVNICAGAPAVIPNVIGTTYIYGTTGIELGSSVYIYNGIYPYSGSNLLISSRTGSLFNIEYVNTILMGSTVSGVLTGQGTISNCGNFTMATTAGSDVGAITHLANINALPISNYRTCNWASFAASADVNMSNHNITSCCNIATVQINSLPMSNYLASNWANYQATANIEINSKNLNSAGVLTFSTTAVNAGQISNVTTINTVALSNYLACNWASFVATANLDLNSKTICNLPTIVMSVGGAISNVSQINGVAYPPTGSWVPTATSTLNMCNFGIINISNLSNVSNINGSAISAFTASNWSSYPAISNLNMLTFSIANCSNLETFGINTLPMSNYLVSNWSYSNAKIDVNFCNFSIANLGSINNSPARGYVGYDVFVMSNAPAGGTGSQFAPFSTPAAALTFIAATYTNPCNAINLHIGPGVYVGNITIAQTNIHVRSMTGSITGPTRINGNITINLCSNVPTQQALGSLSFIDIAGTVAVTFFSTAAGGTYTVEGCGITTTTATAFVSTSQISAGPTGTLSYVNLIANTLTSSSTTTANYLVQNNGNVMYATQNKMTVAGLQTMVYTGSGGSYASTQNVYINTNATSTVQPIILYNQTSLALNTNGTNACQFDTMAYTSTTADTGTNLKCCIRFINSIPIVFNALNNSFVCEGARTTNGVATQYVCIQNGGGNTTTFLQYLNAGGPTAHYYPPASPTFIRPTYYVTAT
jgi:hypothetical protein